MIMHEETRDSAQPMRMRMKSACPSVRSRVAENAGASIFLLRQASWEVDTTGVCADRQDYDGVAVPTCPGM